MVQKQKNIDEAMEVLKDCDLLKIEDILPFFPDFVTIDKFKVCEISHLRWKPGLEVRKQDLHTSIGGSNTRKVDCYGRKDIRS